jgi:hypothetical protein
VALPVGAVVLEPPDARAVKGECAGAYYVEEDVERVAWVQLYPSVLHTAQTDGISVPVKERRIAPAVMVDVWLWRPSTQIQVERVQRVILGGLYWTDGLVSSIV